MHGFERRSWQFFRRIRGIPGSLQWIYIGNPYVNPLQAARIRRKNCQLLLSKPCIYNLSDYRSVSAQNLFTASPYTFLWMTSSDFATFVSFSKKSSPKVGDPRAPHPQPNHKQGESHTQRGFGGFSGFSRFSGFSGCVCRAHGRPRGSCAMPLGGVGGEI